MNAYPSSNTSRIPRERRKSTHPERHFWPMYVVASGILAISAGFLLGGSLFLLRLTGRRESSWQAAAIQAHGHVQLFGWGGLMVLGIGLHFLPRLFSVRIPRPSWPVAILVLMVSGLVLRAVCQPASAVRSEVATRVGTFGLVVAAVLELAAALMTAWLIATMLRRRMTASRRVPSAGVTALIGIAFSSFLIALLVNTIGSVQTARASDRLVPLATDNGTVILGLIGFLVAISIAMSARLFPLYVQTALPRERWLRATAVTLAAGVILKSSGTAMHGDALVGLGQVAQGVSFLCCLVALRVFESRWRLPRRQVKIATDPLQLHIVTSYIWLAAAGVFSVVDGFNRFGISVWEVPQDAERHMIGAGFITVLILGVGAEMLPGLARTPLRWPAARWMTLILANAAALVRVFPLLISGIPSQVADATMASAGLLGGAAIAVFLVNVPLKIRAGSTSDRQTSHVC